MRRPVDLEIRPQIQALARLHRGLLFATPLLSALLALVLLCLLSFRGEVYGRGSAPGWQAPLLLVCLGVSVAVCLIRLKDRAAEIGRKVSFAPYRVLLYCLVTAWLVILFSAPPLDRSTILTATTVALTLGSTLTLVGQKLAPRRWLRSVDLVLFQVVAAILMAELGLRALAQLRPSVLFMRDVSSRAERIAQARYPAGTVRFGFPVNELGHYDAPFVRSGADETVVLSIGDSFSYGVVPHHYHFTTVAERQLPGVAIYNMGVPSINIPEYLYLLIHEGLALEPDLILINLFAGNDLTYRLPERAEVRMWSSWLELQNILLFQVPRRLLLIARLDREHRQELIGNRGDPKQEILTSLADIRTRFPWVDDPTLETPALDHETYLAVESKRARMLLGQTPEGFHQHLAPLLEMRRVAGGVPVLVMLIPDEFQIEGRLWAAIRPPGATRDRRMSSLWITQAWLEENGFPCLNLAPVLRRVGYLPNGRRHLYKKQNTHFGVRGNRVAGRALAEFLRPWVEGEQADR